MKYNEKYDRWCDEKGRIYKEDKNGVLIECKQNKENRGYLRISWNGKLIKSHRLIWETFNGKIPNGYVIDHINTVRDDNRLCNLKCCTVKENNNNPLTIKHIRTARIGNTNAKGKHLSDFGKKYYEHYGYGKYEDIKQYRKEIYFYRKHGKCSWE